MSSGVGWSGNSSAGRVPEDLIGRSGSNAHATIRPPVVGFALPLPLRRAQGRCSLPPLAASARRLALRWRRRHLAQHPANLGTPALGYPHRVSADGAVDNAIGRHPAQFVPEFVPALRALHLGLPPHRDHLFRVVSALGAQCRTAVRLNGHARWRLRDGGRKNRDSALESGQIALSFRPLGDGRKVCQAPPRVGR